MRVAVASGKGGTGKTLIATHLALTYARRDPGRVILGDADVEAPNCHLFLEPSLEAARAERWIPKRVDVCDACLACQEVCAFNAITPLPGELLIFAGLCHGCGACLDACPRSALERGPHVMGEIRRGRVEGLAFVDGALRIGEARATPLVERVIAALDATREDHPIQIVDCPPGTSCAAVAATHSADHALLVTEPTPFGLHDLELAAEMVATLGVPASVILNRADLGDAAATRAWAGARGLPIIAELPFMGSIAVAGAAGALVGGALSALIEAIIARLAGVDA